MQHLKRITVTEEALIRDVMSCIDRGAKGIAIVVDSQDHLIAALTDGDMRRAVLSGMSLDNPVKNLLSTLREQGKIHPVTLPAGTPYQEIVRVMAKHSVRQIPLLDESGRVVDLAVIDDLIASTDEPWRAVVMAGGYGTRLMPLTAETPKPMLKVGDEPLIERLVKQIKQAGITRVNISTHYQGDKIARHFGNGEAFGIEVEYVPEERPLGTAGALSMVQGNEPLLVINGDILTRLDFRALRNFHFEHNADMTVAVREYRFDVPYGVIEADGVAVTGVTEKPTVKFFVSAGIYLISSSARQFVPSGKYFDMPQLIQTLIAAGRTVIRFPIWEYWLDIGRQEDFERAQIDIENMGAAH